MRQKIYFQYGTFNGSYSKRSRTLDDTFAMKQFLLFSREVNVFGKVIGYLLQNPRHFTKLTQTARVWKRNQLFDTAETMHMLHDKK
jgi:hypothetical protein